MATVQRKEEKEEDRKESHIHFICADKDYNSVINIAKFLREY